MAACCATWKTDFGASSYSRFRTTLPIGEVFIVQPLQKFKSKGRNDLKSLQLGEGKLFLHPCNCSGCMRKESKARCSKLTTLGYNKAQPQTGHSEIQGTKTGGCQKPRSIKQGSRSPVSQNSPAAVSPTFLPTETEIKFDIGQLKR